MDLVLLQGYALKTEDGSMYYGRGIILRADKRTCTMAGHAVGADGETNTMTGS
jgi:hypothetical protein